MKRSELKKPQFSEDTQIAIKNLWKSSAALATRKANENNFKVACYLNKKSCQQKW